MSPGRTIKQAAIEQGAAGTTSIVAAPADASRLCVIYVVAIMIVLDAAGSVKFVEDSAGAAAALTGVVPCNLNGGLVIVGGDERTPVLGTLTPNKDLGIVTVAGKAHGWLRYFIDTP